MIPIKSTLLQYLSTIPDVTTANFLRKLVEQGVPLGPYSSTQIAAINAEISAGNARYEIGTTLRRADDGAVLTLMGLDTSAQFLASTGGSVAVQAARSASFNLAPSDSGSIIPCAAALTATLFTGATADASFAVELRSTVAASVSVAAGAATLWFGGVSVSLVTITGKGSSICIVASTTAGEFFASKVGA